MIRPATLARLPARLARAGTLAIAALLAACATVAPEYDRPAVVSLPPAPMVDWPMLAPLSPDRDHLVVLNEGSEALAWRLKALKRASRSIDLQTFIWKDDRSGVALVEAALAAADRGVRVRVLLDDSFLAFADAGIHALSSHPNIAYRIYNPLAERGGNMAVRELENLLDFDRINHRMHNKLLLVDGRLAIIGGRNQADEYFGHHGEHNFRDMEAIVAGPVVADLGGVFDHYWNAPWSIPIEHLDKQQTLSLEDARLWLQEHHYSGLLSAHDLALEWPALFEQAIDADIEIVVDSPAEHRPDSELPLQLAQELRDMVDRSEKELLLVSAYFIPTPEFTAALERATARGVHVRVLTNSLGSNNHVTAHAAYTRHRPALLRAGVELYELRADAADREKYIAAFHEEILLGLHAKVLVIDDSQVVIGSANLDPRSLRLNTEVGLLIHSPGVNEHVRSLFSTDLLKRNAWQVSLDSDGEVLWTDDQGGQRDVPPASFMLRLESWFFGLMPIEGQM